MPLLNKKSDFQLYPQIGELHSIFTYTIWLYAVVLSGINHFGK